MVWCSGLCESREHELSTEHAYTHFSKSWLWMWCAYVCFDFLTIMDYNLELWATISPSSPKLIFLEYFFLTTTTIRGPGQTLRIVPSAFSSHMTRLEWLFAAQIERTSYSGSLLPPWLIYPTMSEVVSKSRVGLCDPGSICITAPGDHLMITCCTDCAALACQMYLSSSLKLAPLQGPVTLYGLMKWLKAGCSL